MSEGSTLLAGVDRAALAAAFTDSVLADRLDMTVAEPSRWPRAVREALITEAARRLRNYDKEATHG